MVEMDVDLPVVQDWPFHPLANIFPLMRGQEFAALVADINKHGLREPVWMYDAQVLDGRNRVRACLELAIPIPVRLYEGGDPVGFVVSMNLRRRHLDESQRGMVAARLANMRQGERTDIQPSANLQKVSQKNAADLLNVSERTVADATKVHQATSPEVIHAVDSGHIAVCAALPLASLPKDEQPQVLATIQQEAGEKKPTATQVKAVVNRTHVVTTVKEELAAGKTPHQPGSFGGGSGTAVLPLFDLGEDLRRVTLEASEEVGLGVAVSWLCGILTT